MTTTTATRDDEPSLPPPLLFIYTEPKRSKLKSRLLTGLYRSHQSIYLLLMATLCAATWFCLYPVVTLTTGELKARGTYFSENALLAYSTVAKIKPRFVTLATSFQQELDQLATPLHQRQWALEVMKSRIGMSVDSQVLGKAMDERSPHTTTTTTNTTRGGSPRVNTYGILKGSSASDGKESLVLVVYTTDPSSSRRVLQTTQEDTVKTKTSTPSALALALSLMTYLSTVPWLAKDVVFLLSADSPTEAAAGRSYATQAWLNAYHADPFDMLSLVSHPMLHAGIIRGALVLETPLSTSPVPNMVSILGSGINGQLPNLDLVNTAVLALRRENIRTTMDRCGTVDFPCHDALTTVLRTLRGLVSTAWQPYVDTMGRLCRFMKTLATGPSGAHAEFINYNIDAITLSAGTTFPISPATTISSLSLLRTTEVLIHTLSNLEEKFHQSFYFYLLFNNHQMVSIGEFLYTLLLLLLPSLAMLLGLVLTTTGGRYALALVFSTMVLVSNAVGFFWMTSLLPSSPDFFSKEEEDDVQAQMVKRGLIVAFILQCIQLEVLHLLNCVPWLSGNRHHQQWLIQHQEESDAREREEAAKEGLCYESIQITNNSVWTTYVDDVSGARAMKMAVLVLVVYPCGILGISNFSLAMMIALVTLPYSQLPTSPPTSGKRLGLTVASLLLASPVMGLLFFSTSDRWTSLLVTLYNYALAYRQNAMVLHIPYLAIVYMSLHTLACGVVLLTMSAGDLPAARQTMMMTMMDKRIKKKNQ